MVRRTIGVVLLLQLAFSVTVVEARDRPIRPVQPDKGKYLAYNVGLTSLFTLVSAMAQHQVKSPRDVLWQLLVGSGAGAGFYEGKRVAGGGRAIEGWLVANAASTVVENTASGESPIGKIGYTVGPFRVRVATPFARTAVARIETDWSFAETLFLVAARREANHVRLRDGLIAVDREEGWPNHDFSSPFDGRTYGVFPGRARNRPRVTWDHEVIHAIQSQQLDSVEPAAHLFGGPPSSEPLRLFAFRNVRLGLIHLADTPTYRRPYDERWIEVEAYGLADRHQVPHPH